VPRGGRAPARQRTIPAGAGSDGHATVGGSVDEWTEGWRAVTTRNQRSSRVTRSQRLGSRRGGSQKKCKPSVTPCASTMGSPDRRGRARLQKVESTALRGPLDILRAAEMLLQALPHRSQFAHLLLRQ